MYSIRPSWFAPPPRGGPYFHVWVLSDDVLGAALETHKLKFKPGPEPTLGKVPAPSSEPAVWRSPQAARAYGQRYHRGKGFMVRQCWESPSRVCPICWAA